MNIATINGARLGYWQTGRDHFDDQAVISPNERQRIAVRAAGMAGKLIAFRMWQPLLSKLTSESLVLPLCPKPRVTDHRARVIFFGNSPLET